MGYYFPGYKVFDTLNKFSSHQHEGKSPIVKNKNAQSKKPKKKSVSHACAFETIGILFVRNFGCFILWSRLNIRSLIFLRLKFLSSPVVI